MVREIFRFICLLDYQPVFRKKNERGKIIWYDAWQESVNHFFWPIYTAREHALSLKQLQKEALSANARLVIARIMTQVHTTITGVLRKWKRTSTVHTPAEYWNSYVYTHPDTWNKKMWLLGRSRTLLPPTRYRNRSPTDTVKRGVLTFSTDIAPLTTKPMSTFILILNTEGL